MASLHKHAPWTAMWKDKRVSVLSINEPEDRAVIIAEGYEASNEVPYHELTEIERNDVQIQEGK